MQCKIVDVDSQVDHKAVRNALTCSSQLRAQGTNAYYQPLLLMEIKRRDRQRPQSLAPHSIETELKVCFASRDGRGTADMRRKLEAVSKDEFKRLFKLAVEICGNVSPTQDLMYRRHRKVLIHLFPETEHLLSIRDDLLRQVTDMSLIRGLFAWSPDLMAKWWCTYQWESAAQLLAVAPVAKHWKAVSAPLRRPVDGVSGRERLLIQNMLESWPRAAPHVLGDKTRTKTMLRS